MTILIALIPALAWGFMPLAVSKIGGKPSNQILGTTAGTFIIAFISLFIFKPEFSAQIFLLSALSGALWVVGQIGQYTGFKKIGVSKTMPISSGLQMVGTSVIGVFIFGEWAGTKAKVIGFIALAFVIIGITLTTLKSKDSNADSKKFDRKTLILLIFTTFGYLAYSSIPAVIDTKGTEIFFPQATGMLIAASLYVLLIQKNISIFKEKISWKNIAAGFLFSAGALSYIISAQHIGIATAFILSQLNVLISTIGGIVILKEHKNKFETVLTFAGLALILAGSITTVFLK